MSEAARSIFDRIIAGEIPCHRVYEDAYVLAFLDINPLSLGHTLVVPKESKATMAELSDESAAALGRALPRICRAIMQATGCAAYNLLQNNGRDAHQEVMHVHVHIIPRRGADGLGVGWKPGRLDTATGASLAERVRSHLTTS